MRAATVSGSPEQLDIRPRPPPSTRRPQKRAEVDLGVRSALTGDQLVLDVGVHDAVVCSGLEGDIILGPQPGAPAA